MLHHFVLICSKQIKYTLFKSKYWSNTMTFPLLSSSQQYWLCKCQQDKEYIMSYKVHYVNSSTLPHTTHFYKIKSDIKMNDYTLVLVYILFTATPHKCSNTFKLRICLFAEMNFLSESAECFQSFQQHSHGKWMRDVSRRYCPRKCTISSKGYLLHCCL